MARKSIKTIPHRRRREGKTNYKNRLNHLLSQKPRLAIRTTNKNVIIQLIEYHPEGDITKVKVNSRNLREYGWHYSKNNLCACYLAGLLAGKKAISLGFKEAVADIGMQSKVKGGRIFSALKGAIDAGLSIPHSEDCFPSEERLKGEHIQNYASSMEEEKGQFSSYYKNDLKPENISQVFEETKQKILES